MKTLFAVLLLMTACVAQVNNGSGSGSGILSYTVATLPASNRPPVAQVTDGISNQDCTVGGGAAIVDCAWNGSAWVAVVVQGAASLSIGTAPTTLGSATGGIAVKCASTAGNQVSGEAYDRCDSTTGYWKRRNQNGTNEVTDNTAKTKVSSGAIGALDATDGPAQLVICTATCSVTPLSPPAADYQLCVVMAAGVTGTITLNALGNSAMYGKTDGSAYGTAGTGTAVSGSATGNRICIVGRDATHYETTGSNGTFTMN